MTKLEKVINGLECCIDQGANEEADCRQCPYYVSSARLACWIDLSIDALELLKERHWISVKDRLPEQGKTVIVARKYVKPGHKEKRYVETAELVGTSWVSVEDAYKIHRQFHTNPYAWMPLPEPPKEEK